MSRQTYDKGCSALSFCQKGVLISILLVCFCPSYLDGKVRKSHVFLNQGSSVQIVQKYLEITYLSNLHIYNSLTIPLLFFMNG